MNYIDDYNYDNADFYNMDNTMNNIKGDNDVIVISLSVHQTKMC